MNAPDNWVVIKVGGDDPHYRLLCSWHGGYIHGDSWRINSGIVSCTKENNCFNFEGVSGSVYLCHKDGYRLSSIMFWALENFRASNIPIEIMEETTDWEQVQWHL